MNKRSFKLAIFIMDEIQGTIDIDRIVEDRCLARPEPVYHNIYGHRLIHVDTQKRFWNDVFEVARILDDSGHYWHKGELLTQANKIAAGMVQDGITWVKSSMVAMAQKRKVKPD